MVKHYKTFHYSFDCSELISLLKLIYFKTTINVVKKYKKVQIHNISTELTVK